MSFVCERRGEIFGTSHDMIKFANVGFEAVCLHGFARRRLSGAALRARSALSPSVLSGTAIMLPSVVSLELGT